MSASPVVIVPKYAKVGVGYSRPEQAKALEHPGRRPDGVQTAASWVTELTDRRKVLILCSFCAPKFNPRRHGYRRFYNPDHTGITPGHAVNGICDGCRQPTVLVGGGGTGYISEETYRLVCTDPVDARRRARAAAGATSAWGRVRALWSRPGNRPPVEGPVSQGGLS